MAFNMLKVKVPVICLGTPGVSLRMEACYFSLYQSSPPPRPSRARFGSFPISNFGMEYYYPSMRAEKHRAEKHRAEKHRAEKHRAEKI
ncbi:hypothetical protein DM02DRAFT_662599 [Periconia macrospinosa]|uniref:Uncharacterized protein n=1 Tax=Periconia macrospinosa TaxID=97972 RepID=A0A2V1D6E8_9PLEO|nr:hypothetical protein DM02DRAFT_662599 [Periconia macrospinosa]